MVDKIEKSIPWLIILTICIMIAFSSGIVLKEVAAADTETATPKVTVNNNAPLIETVTLNGGDNIILIESVTITVSATTTVTDVDGYEDIGSTTGKLYHSLAGSGCSDDDNNCYSPLSCSTSFCSGDSCVATCNFEVWFHATPTDAGTDTTFWDAWIKVIDSENASSSATSIGVEMIALRALDVSGPETLYERYNTGDNTAGTIWGYWWFAQTFTVGNTGDDVEHVVNSVKLKVNRVASPGTGTVAIYDVDGDGKPTSFLCYVDYNFNSLPEYPDDPIWLEFTFTTHPTLSASTKYAIVVSAPNGDDANFIYWYMDSTSPTYTGGSYAYSWTSGGSWSLDTSKDFMFEEYESLSSIDYGTLGPGQDSGTLSETTTVTDTGNAAIDVYLYGTDLYKTPWSIATSSAAFEFDLNDISEPSIAQIDTTHYLIPYTGSAGDGWSVVLQINTSTWAISTSSDAFEFEPPLSSCAYPVISQIDTTHYLVIYSGLDSDGWSVVLYATGTDTDWTITTSSDAFEFDPDLGSYPAIAQIDTTHYLVPYMGPSNNGWAVVLYATGTDTDWTITTSSAAFKFDPTFGLYPAIAQIDTTHYLVPYRGAAGNGWSVVLQVNTSTWAITTSSAAFEFEPNLGSDFSIAQIDTTHYLVPYKSQESYGWSVVLNVNTSTWAITTSSAAFEFEPDEGSDFSVAQIDTTHYLVSYYGLDNDGWSVILEVNTSTWATTKEASFEFDPDSGFYPAIAQIDATHYLVPYTGPFSDGWSVVLGITEGVEIPVEKQEYATSSGTSYDSGTDATSSTSNAVELDLSKPTSHFPNTSTDDLYWGLGIPTGQELGDYSGTTTFEAKTD